eukprot:CAMPEP_0197721378 /NCGR_PEP_ID=MMETSP1434-20131217/4443_1 /TAXON_ID=265543 /ORGANISM="Minutocellus polymorphus, Strain CCMP3303" /LENGTH=196 /DNA_ID=CAMNT_0043306371 /DNA_START=1 /DNA_END=594 /DNA_ORIENTATION=+
MIITRDVTRNDTTANFFVSVCIVFVTSMSTLLLIFAPKFYYIQTGNWEGRRISTRWTPSVAVSASAVGMPQDRLSSNNVTTRGHVLSATTSVQMEQYMEEVETGQSKQNLFASVEEDDDKRRLSNDGSMTLSEIGGTRSRRSDDGQRKKQYPPRTPSTGTEKDDIGLPTTTSVAMEEYMNESERGPACFGTPSEKS